MNRNPLFELQKYGQSFWLDNINRPLITSGELQRLIDEDGLRGITSNSKIFVKAITESNAYDEEFEQVVSESESCAPRNRWVSAKNLNSGAVAAVSANQKRIG